MCPFLQKLRKEEGGQSGGEEEPEEESHTPLPPPMQIIKDPNNPEVNRDETDRFPGFLEVSIRGKWTVVYFLLSSLQALDSDQGSNESDTEQRNKALRGRM